MKRIWSALLALLFVFAFVGCKNKENKTPPAIIPNYEADVKISYNDVNLTCHVVQQNFEENEIEICTPEELKGLIIARTQDGCNLKFKGMNYKMDLSKYPNASFANVMTQAYSKLVNLDGVKVSKEGKYWIYKGSIESGKFIITQNDDTGFIEKIEIPQIGMKAEYSNIKLLSNKQ